MADHFDSSFVDSPATKLGSIPDGYKGTGSHEYNGEEDGPFGSYKRTSTPNGPNEVTYDGNVGPKVTGEKLGKDGEY